MLRTCAVSCLRAGNATRVARGQACRLSTVNKEVGVITPNPTAAKAPSIPVKPVEPVAMRVVKKTGSSLRQRVASFLVGCGVGFGLGYYNLNSELEESTAALLTAIDRLDARLNKSEQRK